MNDAHANNCSTRTDHITRRIGGREARTGSQRKTPADEHRRVFAPGIPGGVGKPRTWVPHFA